MDSQGPAARVGRDGALSLRFERRGAHTALAACRSVLPLQVLAPLALDGAARDDRDASVNASPCVVSMLNPTGCVLGGDHLRVDVRAEPGAHALLTTPSATRVHRTAGPCAVQTVELSLAAGAALEWVPDHTIPHPHSAFRQTVRADVGAGATLVLVDAFAVGRVARGERFVFHLLESALHVRDDDGVLLHDRFVLRGTDDAGAASGWDALGFAEGAAYLATIVVVAPAPVDALAHAARTAAATVAGSRSGVGVLRRRGILVRCLADTAPALADTVQATWTAVRGVALGAPALDLRKY